MKQLFSFNQLRKKILFGFSFVIIIVMILGTYSVLTAQSVNKQTSAIINDDLPTLLASEKIVLNMSTRQSLVRGYFLFGEENVKKQFFEQTEQGKIIADQLLKVTNDEKLVNLLDSMDQWVGEIEKAFTIYENGNTEEAIRLNQQNARPLLEEVMNGFTEHVDELEKSINNTGETVISNLNMSVKVSMIFVTVATIASIIIALITAFLISKPIRNVMDQMKRVANGDLSAELISSRSNDEVGQLIEATNEMQTSMRDLINHIQTVSRTVSRQSDDLTEATNEAKVGSEQITSVITQLATGTEMQANSVTSLAETMSDFAEKVLETDGCGRQVQTYSEDVLSLTNKGVSLMNDSTKQMATIERSIKDAVLKMESLDNLSQEISKLGNVVQDIAEQTNLLALNAAIEAARAGEQGRGFAIVANEVRTLAEQVSVSVQEISSFVTTIQQESSSVVDTLQQSYEQVELGTNQISTTSETFTIIKNSVEKMVERILAISHNLHQIANNSEQMDISIDEIANVAEEAAAGIDETAASSEEVSHSMDNVSRSAEQLASLAEQLNDLTHRFKI